MNNKGTGIKETVITYDNGHQVIIIQEIHEYEIFVSDNGSISDTPIMTVKGLQNALASVSAIIDNEKRLSPDATFLIRQK